MVDKRSKMERATVVQTCTPYAPSTFSRTNVFTYGTWQEVDLSKQQKGTFIPGIYRANTVKMEKYKGWGDFTRLTEPIISSGRRLQVYGDIAAVYLCGFDTSWFLYLRGIRPWQSSLAGLSVQRAYAQMNEADLDVGVMLGELTETVGGLLNPLSALRKFLKQLRKLQRNSPLERGADTLDMLSGSWLEWRYGIMPLIYSIQDIIKHVNSQIAAIDGKIFRKRGSTKHRAIEKGTISSSEGHLYFSGERIADIEEKYTTSLFYNVLQPKDMFETLGLRWADLPSILWELTKLSFVWDWVISVGSWIASLEVNPNRTLFGSCTSQKVRVCCDYRLTSCKMYNVTPVPTGSNEFRFTYERLERKLNQPLPLGPVVNRELLSFKRQVDAAALIWGKLRQI